jgi:hypothetical protein
VSNGRLPYTPENYPGLTAADVNAIWAQCDAAEDSESTFGGLWGDYTTEGQLSTVLNESKVSGLGALAASLGTTITGVINGIRYGYFPSSGGSLASGVRATALPAGTSTMLLYLGLGLLAFLLFRKKLE